ncbi:MAG: hypothetical protein PVH84_16150, partial [Candidatus Aminicenantes bacterium]
AFLGIRALKKNKGEDEGSPSVVAMNRNRAKDHSGGAIGEGSPVCAGCSRIVEKEAIHELGKDWCRDCYKSQVLKIKE